jgi:hypothetical protein
LELQACSPTISAQRFALDGDTILMGKQASGVVAREFAIAPQLSSTNLRTPLAVTNRQVSDSEYFRFKAVDGSSARPTSGFILVSNEAQLDAALALGWGTVIEFNPNQTIILNGPFDKGIHAGVTLRGYRKYTFQGPNVIACTNSVGNPNKNLTGLFAISEDDVRITGLRLHGPLNEPGSICKQDKTVTRDAVLIHRSVPPGYVSRTLIDHLDISYFTGAAVDSFGPGHAESDYQTCPGPSVLPFPRELTVRVIGNFIHHNNSSASISGWGAFVQNQANVMYRQHDAEHLDSDGIGSSGYNAYDNLFLSDSWKTSAVDMHGTGCPDTNAPSCHGHDWQGGLSGDYFDVGWNTFLQTNSINVVQRGTPCRFTAVHDNVFLLPSQSAAIRIDSQDPKKPEIWANIYKASNPTNDLAVGDFDGDGVDDVFVGTGADWYFSSGGQAEWRFLNRMTEHASSLLFGDFDGDGRTDIIAIHGNKIDISWGGMSSWQTINTTNGSLADLAVGDFDGDGVADLFLSTGTQWFYAPGGKNWKLLAISSYRRKDLRFGDFTHQGGTQALRVQNGHWLVAGLGVSWTSIGVAPSLSSMSGLVVGDFNGDGFADLARTNGGVWQFLTPAHSTSWSVLRVDSGDIATHPIGRFNNDRTSDVLYWNELHFSYAPSGRNPVQTLSRQDMR